MKLYAIIILILFYSCNQKPKLETAFLLAGDNRIELEKVLNHYSEHIEDSLKLKAAIFLIENMPGHRSYYGKGFSEYCTKTDSILNMDIIPVEKHILIDSIAKLYPELNHHIRNDIEIMTANYLINNIDAAFEQWKTKTWNKSIDFEQFCEFLLPYKIAELQPIDYWRDTLYTEFKYELRPEPGYPGFNWRYFSQHPAHTLNWVIRNKLSIHTITYSHYPFLASSSLSRIPYGVCDDYTILALGVLRSNGIPVVMEYIPTWATQDIGHSWYSILDKGRIMPSPWGIESVPGNPFFPQSLFPKVFRKTYSYDDKYKKYIIESKFLHPSFSAFQKDVTSEYIQVSNIDITVDVANVKDKYVYISLFDNVKWKIVDIGILKSKKAHFENMGRGIIYMIQGYNGHKLEPISLPFLLDFDGSIRYFAYNEEDRENSVKLTRKFTKGEDAEIAEDRILGGKIQASNNKDFSTYKTFYTIDSLMFPDIAKFENNGKYRYWRYYSPPKSSCNLAELQFFEKEGSSEIPVKGEIIGTIDEIYANDPYWRAENCFDGDWLTMFHYAYEDDGWIGLDLGEPKCIDRFRCIPRSDDNGIHYGDEYELLYWHNNNWKSVGRQIAKEKFLTFNNVPKTLLRLKNHTRGKQERIFTYENGSQVWW